MSYVNGADFNPTESLTEAELRSMFTGSAKSNGTKGVDNQSYLDGPATIQRSAGFSRLGHRPFSPATPSFDEIAPARLRAVVKWDCGSGGNGALWGMPSQNRYPLIFNPKARSQRGRRALRFLMEQANQFVLYATKHSGEARELAARFAAAGEPVVIAAGGDGTVNEVVGGLAGTDTALGVLPTGTMNVFARELGLPYEDLGKCFGVIRAGFEREIDLFEANGSPFVQMAVRSGFSTGPTTGTRSSIFWFTRRPVTTWCSTPCAGWCGAESTRYPAPSICRRRVSR
jgi:hypothetical protein